MTSTMQIIRPEEKIHSYVVGFATSPPQKKPKENRKKTIIDIKVKHNSERRKTAADKRYRLYKFYILHIIENSIALKTRMRSIL